MTARALNSVSVSLDKPFVGLKRRFFRQVSFEMLKIDLTEVLFVEGFWVACYCYSTYLLLSRSLILSNFLAILTKLDVPSFDISANSDSH